MADAFTTLKRLSFGGVEFPFTEISIKGSLRHHLHEFIKRPGGEVETLARRAYSITVRCDMIDAIIPIAPFAQWVDVYPSRLAALVTLCEQGLPQDLFLPNFGKAIRAKAVDWSRTITAARRSGEAVEFQFLEDSSEAFSSVSLIGSSATVLLPKAANLQIEVENLDDVLARDAFERLEDALDRYNTAKDDALNAAEYQVARIDAVIARCNELVSVPSMSLATSATANTAALDLFATAIHIKNEIAAASRPLLALRTPRPAMSVLDVSFELYGKPSFAAEILRLNDLDDAMNIPYATPLNYFAPLP